MEFRIAKTFEESLSRLTNDEQKAAKITVTDLQLDPSAPGLSFHKLDRAQDPNFASVRISRDLRLIVHQLHGNLLICYVGHHDNAYQWAERRKLEVHPTTGAAQIVEVREVVQDVIIPNYIVEDRPKPRLFAKHSDETLLNYGVPPEWLEDVRNATEDTILYVADHLPEEAAEALLELALGGAPQPTPKPAPTTDPFDHPDALRRFRIMGDNEELVRALEYPWEQWAVFLHPEQRRIATADYNGPARVSGSAGTGKTVVALHRAVHLARTNPNSRVLLVTFSDTLANALRNKLRVLIHNQPVLGEQIEVYAMNALGERLHSMNLGRVNLATPEVVHSILMDAAKNVDGLSFNPHFLVTEWEQIIDAWQVKNWEDYKKTPRLGRQTRLPEARKQALWSIFEQTRSILDERDLVTHAGIFARLTDHFLTNQRSPFDFIVVDEAQDVNVPQLKFLAALAGERQNGLFFAGDLGQRIFQQPFSWKSLGVDVRGRSKALRINYRTSHQIRSQADKLLGPELADVDGNIETRKGTISVFNGPMPLIETFNGIDAEIEAVAAWFRELTEKGLSPEEMGVIVRSESQLSRARSVLEMADLPYKILDQRMETIPGHVSLCTMHLAKGLEFRAVAVMACDDEVIPLQERITTTEASDLEDVYNTERHLLYVACTRARDYLLVTGVDPASEFLVDMGL